jgi:dTDP-4-amino-4,6-dideoxygalactose transaminase
MEFMRYKGVQTSIHYPPVHCFRYYQERYPGITLPVTEAIAAREVTLPLYPGLNENDIDYVLSVVEEAMERSMQMT